MLYLQSIFIIKPSHEYISKVISFVLGFTSISSESRSSFYAEGEHSARGTLVSLEVYKQWFGRGIYGSLHPML